MADGPLPHQAGPDELLAEMARIKQRLALFERADLLRVENALARIDQRLDRIERMIAFLPLPPEPEGARKG
jgi:hypothetical protein